MSGPTNRTDEPMFRATVPDYVGRFPVIAVGRYIPGSRSARGGTFASAVVLTTEDRQDPRAFATHMIFFDDERGRWEVYQGEYRLDLAMAAESMNRRGGLT